jgi:hypothetical protein
LWEVESLFFVWEEQLKEDEKLAIFFKIWVGPWLVATWSKVGLVSTFIACHGVHDYYYYYVVF